MTALPSERPSTARGGRRRGRPGAAAAAVTFADVGVPAPLVAALAEAGITTPFPIQAATLPDSLAGLDILGRGQTGSGKTLGFSIPLAARLADGGVPQNPQVARLRDRTDIVVACPGRLADLIEQGHCHLGDVEISVLDEADHMADLGFLPVVRRLLDMTPPEGQRMLFSATLDTAVDVLARRFMNRPAQHSVGPTETPTGMIHHLLTVTPSDRTGVVAVLAGGSSRSLVFTRTRRAARKLARQLVAAGILAGELHGDLTQSAREGNLASFAAGAVRVMVATDIAARGIHVDGIGLVIHADSPAEHKAYLHRSGRTARAGTAGTVITLQTPAQADTVRALMRKAGVVPLTATVTPGSALLRSIAGEPAPPVMLPARPAARAETIAAAPATGRDAAAHAKCQLTGPIRHRVRRDTRVPAALAVAPRAAASG